MSAYNASEVFQFAIQIEENGERFYRALATSIQDIRIKELFNFLANEESAHSKIFENLVHDFKDYEPAELYPDEYFIYLRSMANNMVFSRDFNDIVNEIDNDPKKALSYAIKQEKEAIQYYEEIMKMVPEDEQKHVEELLEEERSHLVKLTEFAEERRIGV